MSVNNAMEFIPKTEDDIILLTAMQELNVLSFNMYEYRDMYFSTVASMDDLVPTIKYSIYNIVRTIATVDKQSLTRMSIKDNLKDFLFKMYFFLNNYNVIGYNSFEEWKKFKDIVVELYED